MISLRHSDAAMISACWGCSAIVLAVLDFHAQGHSFKKMVVPSIDRPWSLDPYDASDDPLSVRSVDRGL